MDRNEREALDRHITGNHGADQEIEHPWDDEEDLGGDRGGEGLSGWVRVEDADSLVPQEGDPPRTYHSDRLGAVTIPEDGQ